MNRLALTALALLLAGCSASGTPAPSLTPTPTPTTPRLVQAAIDCGVGSSRVQDKGASLSLDTKGQKETSGDEIFMLNCVLAKTGAPSYVADHINTTRALDGTQSDEWDGYKARWTYHPDAGVRITFIDSRLTTS